MIVIFSFWLLGELSITKNYCLFKSYHNHERRWSWRSWPKRLPPEELQR